MPDLSRARAPEDPVEDVRSTGRPRDATRQRVVRGVVAGLLLWAAPFLAPTAAAQDALLRNHLDPVLATAPGTPDGGGLLPTALAEAQIALAHARLATKATDDLVALHAYARGVVHAIDPTLVTTGPGRGYGVRRAVTEIAQRMELMASASPQPDVLRSAPRAVAAARQVLTWTDALVDTAYKIEQATNPADAALHVPELQRLARQLTYGVDVDGDTRITDAAGEPGLTQLRATLRALLAHRTVRQTAEAAP